MITISTGIHWNTCFPSEKDLAKLVSNADKKIHFLRSDKEVSLVELQKYVIDELKNKSQASITLSQEQYTSKLVFAWMEEKGATLTLTPLPPYKMKNCEKNIARIDLAYYMHQLLTLCTDFFINEVRAKNE